MSFPPEKRNSLAHILKSCFVKWTSSFERTEIITSKKKKNEQAELPAEETVEEEKESKGILWKILIALDLVILLLIAAVCGFTYNIRQSDQIFPGITVADIDLGGKTVEEAVSVMNENGWAAMGEENVTAALPAGYKVTVNAAQSGAIRPAEEIAQIAEEYGKNTSFFGSLAEYLHGMTSTRDIFSETQQINEDYVKDQISGAVEEMYNSFPEKPYDVNLETGEVTIIRSAQGLTIDQKEIQDEVMEALKARNFTQVQYDFSSDIPENTVDIQGIHDSIYREVKNAVYDPSTGAATQSSSGVDFNVEEATALVNGANIGDVIKVPIIVTEPTVTTEALNAKLFANQLGAKSSSFASSSSNRVNNIVLAAQKINGKVLNPGESFSYNGTVGQRTAAAGFKEAGAYLEGKVVQEIGGGICQVSSTLYNAALLANLKITSRTNHYFPVSYLPDGLDATVSWQSPDFRFVNNTAYPIKILASTNTSSMTLNIEIVGTNEAGTHVVMTSDTSKIFDPNNPSVATGYTTTTYRNVYNSANQLISSNVEAKSTYHYHTADD